MRRRACQIKNKCEEILEGSDGGEEISGVYAVCVFDLNNLRTINNSLGHDKETNISVPLPFSFEKQSRRSISSEETAEMSFLPFCAD